MKTVDMKSQPKRLILGTMTLLVIFLFSSCTRQFSFQNSTIVPAAQGDVSVKKDKNSNYIVEVQITDLAEIDRLEGNKSTYVVWMISENERMENVGQLISKRSAFTKQLKASLKTVTTSKPIKVQVTAENDGNVQYPMGPIVLSTDRF